MTARDAARFSTGIEGLDGVLQGGFLAGRSYLVRGGPGTGKTTLGMHFLAAGPPSESLFVTLGEDEERLRQDGANIGLDLKDVAVLDVSPRKENLTDSIPGDVFSAAETDRAPLIERIQETVERLRPKRVFVDSLTQFRYLAPDAYQFRQHVLNLLHFLTSGGTTVLFTSEASSEAPDEDLQFLADGILDLTRHDGRHMIDVTKLRGAGFTDGPHAVRLTDHGMAVFPRLVPEAHGQHYTPRTIPLGVEELDSLLGGGLETGTATMLSGPTGVGKTTLGLQILKAAAERGERSVLYTFEEHLGTLLQRSAALGIPLRELMEAGTISVVVIEPHRFIADEFALQVREEVESRNARLVMIDSIGGYHLALGAEDSLVLRIRALTRYLFNMDVSVLLVNELHTVIGGAFHATERDISPIADTVVVLRYLEMEGGMRKAIGVLKKRTGDFEHRFREFLIGADGVRVGAPMTGMRGIMAGTPESVRTSEPANGA